MLSVAAGFNSSLGCSIELYDRHDVPEVVIECHYQSATRPNPIGAPDTQDREALAWLRRFGDMSSAMTELWIADDLGVRHKRIRLNRY